MFSGDNFAIDQEINLSAITNHTFNGNDSWPEEGSGGRECSNEYCLPDEDYMDLIEAYIFPTAYEWVLIALHFAVFLAGLFGNSLVCVSVYRNHAMRTVTNYFIVNLALADFMVILICLPPTVLWDVTETWFFGSVMCKLVLYLQSVSVSVSVLTLTFISLDRWYAICHPLRSKSTAARAKTAIALIWIVSLLFVLPEALVLETKPHPNLKVDTHYLTDCAYGWSLSETRLYQLFIVLLLYVAPFSLMLVAYCQIVKVLWSKNIPGYSGEEHPPPYTANNRRLAVKHRNGAVRYGIPNPSCEGQIRSRRKAAKMLIAVVVIFALCYLPVHLINTLRYTTGLPQSHVTTVASLLSHWLCYANSAINPIIYNFMSGKFRKEFRKTFRCATCRRVRFLDANRRRSQLDGSLCRYYGNSFTQLKSWVESLKPKTVNAGATTNSNI